MFIKSTIMKDSPFQISNPCSYYSKHFFTVSKKNCIYLICILLVMISAIQRFIGKIKRFLSSIVVIISNGLLLFGASPKLFYRLIRNSTNENPQIKQIGKANSFLWESVLPEYLNLLFYFKSRKWRIIGIPQNLESLVPFTNLCTLSKNRNVSISKEQSYLSYCDVLVTISREEEWLLKLFGHKTMYLPYYPPKAFETILLEIRNKREKQNCFSDEILMLGTASNPPTKIGLIDRIEFFKSAKLDSIKLHIAGYYTECLSTHLDSNCNMVLHGTVSESKLNELLCQVKAVLIHQPPSTGALTRIVEMLIAGVPVILNSNSARSCLDYDGVYIYNTDEELLELLKRKIGIPFLPKKNIAIEKKFIDLVSNTTSNR